MNKIVSFLLAVHGFLVYHFSKLNSVALGKYKTHLVKKYNPAIISVGGGTSWNHLNKIHIGANSYINGAELLTTNDTDITIGSNCLISYEVVMRTDTHKISNKDKPIIEQGNNAQSIVVGDNVWIGHGVYIMPGVHIGDNSVIGAKAVVTKDIPSDSIAVGVPARVVKNRL